MNELEKERYAIQNEILVSLADIQRTCKPIELSIGWIDENGTEESSISSN